MKSTSVCFPAPEQSEEWGGCEGANIGYLALPPLPVTRLSLNAEKLREWSWSLTSQNLQGSQRENIQVHALMNFAKCMKGRVDRTSKGLSVDLTFKLRPK